MLYACTRTLAAILVVAVATAPAAFAQPAGVAVAGSMFHNLEVVPGQTVDGTIRLHNRGERVSNVRLYVQDIAQLIGDDGYQDAGATSRSIAPWLTLTRTVLSIPPGETVEATYQLSVPTGDNDGTFFGAVMVELDTVVTQTAHVPEGAGPARDVTIHQVFRHAVYLAATLDETPPSVEFLGVELGASNDGPYVQTNIRNTGSTLTRVRTWVEIYDAAGAKVAQVGGDPAVVFPAGEHGVQIHLPADLTGEYQVLLYIDDGARVTGRRVRLTL